MTTQPEPSSRNEAVPCRTAPFLGDPPAVEPPSSAHISCTLAPSSTISRSPATRHSIPSPLKKVGGVPAVAVRQHSRPHAAQSTHSRYSTYSTPKPPPFHKFHTFHPLRPTARTPNSKNMGGVPILPAIALSPDSGRPPKKEGGVPQPSPGSSPAPRRALAKNRHRPIPILHSPLLFPSLSSTQLPMRAPEFLFSIRLVRGCNFTPVAGNERGHAEGSEEKARGGRGGQGFCSERVRVTTRLGSRS